MQRRRDRPGNGKPIDPREEVEGEKYFCGDLGFRHPRRFTMPDPETLDNDRLTDWRL